MSSQKNIRLKPKQIHFVKEFIKTGDATKAALASYDTINHKTAGVIGFRNMHNERVLTYMQSILDNAGVDDDFLALQLRNIIDKSLTKKALNKISPSDGLRGIEMAYRLRDRFPATRMQMDKRELSIKLQGKSPEELLQVLTTLQEEIGTFKKMASSQSQEIPKEANEV